MIFRSIDDIFDGLKAVETVLNKERAKWRDSRYWLQTMSQKRA